MLDAGTRQDGAIYKRNGAKNHQNTQMWVGRIATGTDRGMSGASADFAILGSTPLARLVAGLLASAHGKSVLFGGESQSAYRLLRGLDLSVAPVTRPESWALLKALLPETLRLVSRIGGRRAWSRIDPIVFTESAAGREALGHIRHMALGFGHAAEPVPPAAIGPGRDGILLRDTVLLHRPALETGLDQWLEQSGVRRIAPHESLRIEPDGRAELAGGDSSIAIGQTILADDAAIIAHLAPAQWPALLARRGASTIFTEPTRPIAAPVMHRLESGLTLVQQQDGRGIAAMGPGSIDPFAAALGILLGRERDFRRAGQSSYETLVTMDGAPALGRVGGGGPDVLAGLGPSGVFLAPAIARWLCGRAEPAEAAWCGARLVDRDAAASLVAEYRAAP